MKKRQLSIKTVYLIIVLMSAVITLGTLLYLKLTTTDGVVLKNDLTFQFRSEVHVSDFISYIDGKLIDDYMVDTNEVGFKDIVITFKNKYGFIVGKNITIEIKDVTPPTIVVNNPYIVEVGSIDNLSDNIFCADDYDDLINCNIKGEYDLNTIGKYNLEMIASDKSGNTTNKEFVLDVVSKKKTTSQGGSSKHTNFKTIYNKYKNENTLIGLDISKWQGDVDYAKIKKEGVEFVMLKIGGQTKINGEFSIDPKFYDNIEGALANDIKVGVYFYSYATNVEEAKKQADFIMQKLDNYDIDMPIAFDWENWSKYTRFHISFHTLNKVASAFIDRVEEFGYDGVLYSSKYYLENIWYQEDYTNWLAYYNDEFDKYQDYYMWQMCNNGKINGINGYVDIDIMYNK